jgi:uncharacterized RDD family membrane protein YckC
VIEHQGSRPKFCQHCGEPLSGTKTDLAEAATIVGPSADESSAALPDVTQQLGEYRLVRELGRGGMGVVYEAEHADTGRRLALKVLSPNLPRNSVTVERFLREGRLAAAVSHPCSTFVYGAGETGGQLHIAMELVPGRTLARVVQEDGPLPVNKAADYILDVIDGLIAAHDVGVIHRDVKPSNCFLGEDGRVKVGDFGLSKSLVTDASLTRTGEFMGTPQYAAPEQVRGGEVDARTDIYSVGATLFYLLSGRGPFVGDVASVIAQIASDAPPSLHGVRAEVPRELDRLVARSLAKDPGGRFDDLAQFRQALLPFATAGVSIADVGRRLAAYFLDTMLCAMATGFVGTVYVVVCMLTGRLNLANMMAFAQFGASATTLALMTAYFAVCEGRWGCALGKRLLGLRVVNLSGETPGVGRALLRALLIPGLTYLPALLEPLWFSPQTSPYEMSTSNHLQLLDGLLGWLLTLGVVSTMRARNGYRGLHDLASGTRVVRPQHAPNRTLRLMRPVIAPVVGDDGAAACGPYTITGTLGRSGDATIRLASDDALQRTAWVRVGHESEVVSAAGRINLTRRARPMWLQSGRAGELCWEAYEAIHGSPLEIVAAQSPGGAIPWEQGRLVLLELADELAAAAVEGTVPAVLTLAQVWVDRGGHLKLLDAPVVPVDDASAIVTDGLRGSAVEQAVELLRAAVPLCTGGRALPVHAVEFIQELNEKPLDAATLTWARERLREVSRRHGTLRWDDRLGVLAASVGTEQSAYMLYAMIVSGACMGLPGIALPVRALVSILLCLALPAVVGFWLRGGPVFRLTGIAVRRGNNPASRARCGWRSFVAWSPNMLAWASLGILMPLWTDPEARDSVVVMVLSTVWSLPLLIHFGGAMFSLVSPTRGLQDLLAGTSLAPR